MNIKEDKLKQEVINYIDSDRALLTEIALKIHANPELGLEEFKASNWLNQYLTSKGFTIDRGICKIPTAFRATYGKNKPQIALLAEYDALPGVGHACGHNLICTIAVGAAAASKQVVDRYGGSIIVIGTPAEEMLGGKVMMAKEGAFDDLDAALIVHPDTIDMATSNALACQNLMVEFYGKSAHAAASPERGINALEAMIMAFNGINSLRQHIRSTARIHGIITDGGKVPNVVPDYSAATFIVRAADNSYLDELEEKVLNCFVGAATATGAKLEYKWDELRYAAMRSNMNLAHLYADNMRKFGREVYFPKPDASTGSTDMGNVSQLTPSIHAMVAIATKEISIHSPEFAIAAASEKGICGMLDAAKAVAMTVFDLLSNSATMRKVSEEFNQGK